MRTGAFGIKTALIGLAAVFAVNAALAQSSQRIATIDLQMVFDNYYKTKIADSKVKERGGEFEKHLKDMYAEYKQVQKEYKKLLSDADNQVISSQERRRKKKLARKKLNQMRQLEQQVQKYDRRARTTLQEQQQRMRERLMGEIQKVVAKVAQSEGYTLVLDSAAQTINQTPVLVFSNGQNDISDRVLKRLNADAPENLPQIEEDSQSEGGLGPGLQDLPDPGNLDPNR